jgi:hypothetical protein
MSDRSCDRLESETNAAWLGFCCYRDLGPGRTVEEAWRVYSKARGRERATNSSKRHHPSAQFSRWKTNHDWDDRCAEFDKEQSDRIQAAIDSELLDQSMAAISRLRDLVESAATKAIENSLKAADYSALQIDRINKMIRAVPADRPFPSAVTREFGTLGQQNLVMIRAIKESTEVLERAYGIRLLVDQAIDQATDRD